MSQADLVRVTGESRTSISAYCTGERTPGAATAIRIADALDTTVEYLILGRQRLVATEYAVPILDVRLAAGAGSFATHEMVSSYMTLPDHVMRTLGRTTTEGLSMVEIEGDSNEPIMRDGALVLIDETDTRIREGFFFAFRIHDQLRIKRLRPFGVGGIEAISANPAYPPETYEGPAMEHFKVIGRARWNTSPL